MLKSRIGYALLLPSVAVLGILIFYPVFEGIRQSFTDFNLLQPESHYVGLANYSELLSSHSFRNALWQSVVLTIVVTILQYLLGLGLAVALKQEVPGIWFFRSAAMASWVIPVVATVVMFQFMAQPRYGFFNIMLTKLGLERYTTYWFGSKSWAFPLIGVLHLWRNVPFYGIALLAAMQSIPQELYEAAEIDGASAWKRFVYITVPGVKHMSMVIITIHVIFTFNNFDFIYLSTKGGPVETTMVLPVYLYIQAWEYFRGGYAASIGMVMLIMLATFFVFFVRIVGEREV